jgi:hypothetical protein
MASISDQLRNAIQTCGKSRYRIAAETGVTQATLSRFMNRLVELNMATADKICESIGARLTIDKPAKAKATKRPTRKKTVTRKRTTKAKGR